MKKLLLAIVGIFLHSFAAEAATISYTNNTTDAVVTYLNIKVYYAIPEAYWCYEGGEQNGITTTECAFDMVRLTIGATNAIATAIPWSDWVTDTNELWWSEATSEPVMLLAYPDAPSEWELENVPSLVENQKYAVYDRRILVNLMPGQSVSTILPNEVPGILWPGDSFVSPYVSYSITPVEEPLP